VERRGFEPLTSAVQAPAPTDLRAQNLVETRHGAHKPQANAGRASSLERRQEVNATLLQALAERANPTLAELSALTGSSEARVSGRLVRLAAKGLTQSPQCCPGRSWCLTEAGRAIVAIPNSVVIDDLNKRLLAALAPAPMRQLVLSRRVGVCSLTVRRRTELLIGHGLLRRDAAKRFSVTDAGLAALPDAPKRWINTAAISAANAKDVRERGQDDRTTAQRSAHSSMGAAKAAATMRANKAAPFNTFPEWSRTG
jgi:hypothetical protein